MSTTPFYGTTTTESTTTQIKKETKKDVPVSLSTFLDSIGKELIVLRYSNQNERWSAYIDGCEIKEGHLLSSPYGTGDSSDEAIYNYIKLIRNRVIVFNAYNSDLRKTYLVPELLYYK